MANGSAAHDESEQFSDSPELTEAEKRALRFSFKLLEPSRDHFVELFHRNLFQAHPELRHMFSGDLGDQRRKLVTTLKLAVESVEQINDVTPTLKLLGTGHRIYGVAPEQYDHFREALLVTLEQCLKKQFTGDARSAWAKVHDYMAGVMTGEE
jgi:hemoglobin-like flavoprotein